ncbi:hypothetical protein RCOM_0205200 [Ricinus communis]|uniref:Uncharacterized protein n=1 Tax=Ricinus communis TaxID=3988 RepID=B9SPS0_RICCO|nr:hypothetical protein RCOM_0205200 [Ricinus communis]
MDSKKSNKIREIVRLQQILKKWRKMATSSSSKATATTSNGSKASMVEDKKDVYSVQEFTLGHCSSKSHQTPSHHPQSPMCR